MGALEQQQLLTCTSTVRSNETDPGVGPSKLAISHWNPNHTWPNIKDLGEKDNVVFQHILTDYPNIFDKDIKRCYCPTTKPTMMIFGDTE